MSTFDTLVEDLTRDVQRAQPNDVLQFCASWFQSRLEEQRARTRNILSQRSCLNNIPEDLYNDNSNTGQRTPSPASYAIQRSPMRGSIARSPFGTLNVPGNALLHDSPNPTFRLGSQEQPPTSPLSSTPPTFNHFGDITPTDTDPGDFFYPPNHPPNSAIFQRRSSVFAESINVDTQPDVPPPVYPKTPQEIEQIKSITRKLFIFRDLAEEQEKAVLGAMQKRLIRKGDLLIRQGDFGDAFYVVQTGLLHVFIKGHTEGKYPRTVVHPELGTKVAECPNGSYVGELALLYGHPRAASVLAMADSHLWSLDRMTFRTIVLKLAHKRRMMYEDFLGSVELFSTLDAQQKSKIADALNREIYEDGMIVVREGDFGQDKFFLIEEGEVSVTQRGREIGYLKKGDYFGELSLLHEQPRAASVVAKNRLVVAALDAAAFRRLLGPLKDVMEEKAGGYGSFPGR